MTKVMENIQSSKDFVEKSAKLTLKGYYKSLPERFSPKQRLLEDIQQRCEELTGEVVTVTTLRNWVLYGRKPRNPLHVRAISEITGIKEEYLWQ